MQEGKKAPTNTYWKKRGKGTNARKGPKERRGEEKRGVSIPEGKNVWGKRSSRLHRKFLKEGNDMEKKKSSRPIRRERSASPARGELNHFPKKRPISREKKKKDYYKELREKRPKCCGGESSASKPGGDLK